MRVLNGLLGSTSDKRDPVWKVDMSDDRRIPLQLGYPRRTSSNMDKADEDLRRILKKLAARGKDLGMRLLTFAAWVAWKVFVLVAGATLKLFKGDAEDAPKIHEGDKNARNTRPIDPPGPQQFL